MRENQTKKTTTMITIMTTTEDTTGSGIQEDATEATDTDIEMDTGTIDITDRLVSSIESILWTDT